MADLGALASAPDHIYFPDNPTVTRPSQAAFAFILVTVLLDTLAFGVMVPVLPKLLITLQGGDTAGAATILGIFGTVWAVMQFIASPILGSLSDRFGRRPVILISMAGLSLDYVLMALAPTVSWLFIGRVLSGITTSGFPTAMAYIADTTAPEDRAKRFGLVGAAWGFGFIVAQHLAAFWLVLICAHLFGCRRGYVCLTQPMACSSCRNRFRKSAAALSNGAMLIFSAR